MVSGNGISIGESPVPKGFFVVDAETAEIMFADTCARNALELGPDMAQNVGVVELVDRRAFLEAVGEDGFEAKFRLALENGESRTFDGIASPVTAETGRRLVHISLAWWNREGYRPSLDEALKMARLGLLEYLPGLHVHLCSKVACEILEIDAPDGIVPNALLIGRLHPDDTSFCFASEMSRLEQGKVVEQDFRLSMPDGRVKFVHAMARLVGGPALRYIGVLQDVTERVTAERALEENEKLLAEYQSLAKLGGWSYNPSTRSYLCTPEMCRIFELPESATPLHFETLLARVTPRHRRRVVTKFHKAVGSHGDSIADFELTMPDGREKHVRARGRSEKGTTRGGRFYGTVQDVTELTRSEAALQRSNWVYATLLDCTNHLIHASSVEDLMSAICEAMTHGDIFPVAWLGVVMRDEPKSVEVHVSAGRKKGYVEGLKVSWGETPYGRGPTGMAIVTGQSQIHNFVVNEPTFYPWRSRALQWGLKSSLAIPIRVFGEIEYVLCAYSEQVLGFGENEIRLFGQLADEVGYGVEARRTRDAFEASLKAQREHAEKVHVLLSKGVGAIAAMLELRDPYTAGHQQNVSKLAVAIGQKMGLPDEFMEGLQLASLVHDVGKMRVPVEILMKPRELTPLEFELVKLHPRAGYDVLKDLDCPWPIAQTVLQHHEYLDGSGYPSGLSGNEIILEARIVTVADIVEAMSSDRPYRAALSTATVLNELAMMRGSKLDPNVVDACVSLIESGKRVY